MAEVESASDEALEVNVPPEVALNNESIIMRRRRP